MNRAEATLLQNRLDRLIKDEFTLYQGRVKVSFSTTGGKATIELKAIATTGAVDPSTGTPVTTPGAPVQTQAIVDWCRRNGIDPTKGFTYPGSGAVHYLTDYNSRAHRTPVITVGPNGKSYRWPEANVLSYHRRLPSLASPVVGAGVMDAFSTSKGKTLSEAERELREAMQESVDTKDQASSRTYESMF